MTVTNMHPMTLTEANAILASIGYDPDWTLNQLKQAVPKDMARTFALALRVTAAADHAEANGLERG